MDRMDLIQTNAPAVMSEPPQRQTPTTVRNKRNESKSEGRNTPYRLTLVKQRRINSSCCSTLDYTDFLPNMPMPLLGRTPPIFGRSQSTREIITTVITSLSRAKLRWRYNQRHAWQRLMSFKIRRGSQHRSLKNAGNFCNLSG